MNLTLDQIKSLSIDEIIRLYKIGYSIYEERENKLENNSPLYNSPSPIRSMTDPIVDPFVNFGKATISQGYSGIDTNIVLSTGGSIFPDPSIDGSFNLVWWNATDYGDPSDDPNKEIVRCISRSGNNLIVMRAQEGTAASIKNLSGKTYKIALAITAKVFTDLQTDSQTRVNQGISTHSSQFSGVHGVTGNIVGTSDIQSLTNKTITDSTNNLAANSLKNLTTIVDVSGSAAPTTGQILTATSSTTATWQSMAAPQCFFVSLVASPAFGTFPLAVNYNATVIGGIAPYTYLWTFGDGNTSTLSNPSHTFTVNGTFTTTLTVTDRSGNNATSATVITVTTGIGIVATGLGLTESLAVPDLLAGIYNAGPLLSDIYSVSDTLAGIYNASINMGSPQQDSVTISDTLAGIYNASVGMGSSQQDSIAPSETVTIRNT